MGENAQTLEKSVLCIKTVFLSHVERTPYRSVSRLRGKLRQTGFFLLFPDRPASLGSVPKEYGARIWIAMAHKSWSSAYRSVSRLRGKLRRMGFFLLFRDRPASLGSVPKEYGARIWERQS